jgi:hypothetical protein
MLTKETDRNRESEQLQKAIAALGADEGLLDCVLEMIDTADDNEGRLKTGDDAEDNEGRLKTGDDAEDAVVDVIQKTGAVLLQKWTEKQSSMIEKLASVDRTVRPHEKKVCWHTTLGDIKIVAQGFLRPKKRNSPSKRTLPLLSNWLWKWTV